MAAQSNWNVGTLKEYVDMRLEAAARLQDSKWESQAAHNVAANEWRGTIGDLKREFTTRLEHTSLEQRFAAETLATARTLSQTSGEKSGSKSTNDDSRANMAIAISIVGAVASAVITISALLLRHGT